MRANGSGQRRLVGLPHRDDWAPMFSRDGRLIAFESRGVSRADLYVVGADGRGLKLVVGNAAEPAWRPASG